MAGTEKIVQPADEGLYDLLSQKAFVNSDTMGRMSNIQVAMEGGLGTLASPLNAAAGGRTTTIKILDNASSKLRVGGCAIRIRSVIHAQGNTNATAPALQNYPSWCNVARLISKVTVTVNDATGSGTFYASSDGHFLEEFIARCLTQYTWEQLSSMSETLFTPMDDRKYIVASAAGVANENAIEATAKIRYNEYTLNSLNTHHTEICKIIPLSLLCGFPRDGICKNIRSITIEIRWTSGTNLLDHASTTAAALADISVVGCDALCDHYLPSANQMVNSAALKSPDMLDQEMDILPFLHTDFHQCAYNANADIIIPNVKSFHSVMIFQIAAGFTNGKVDGAEAADKHARSYGSFGQFIFGGNSVANDDVIRTAAFHAAGVAAGSLCGWESAQISYKNQDYPSQSMMLVRTTNGTVAPDFTQCYIEYLKAIGRMGRKDTGGSIPFSVFRTTLPFIMFKPFSDTPKLPGDAGDLIIRLRGGVSSNIAVICFTYKIAAIAPSGVLTMY